jgi:hypothetical protein
MTKSVSKAAARKTRVANHKTGSKGRGKTGNKRHKTAPKLAAEMVRDTRREGVAQFEQFRAPQMPDSLRVLAESNVAQTRELYERSKSTVQAVLESWQKSFGAVAQGAVGFNRTMIDSAERNIDTAFELATGLAGARNFSEVMELQAAYWRKLLGERLTYPAGRAHSSKARVQTRNR